MRNILHIYNLQVQSRTLYYRGRKTWSSGQPRQRQHWLLTDERMPLSQWRFKCTTVSQSSHTNDFFRVCTRDHTALQWSVHVKKKSLAILWKVSPSLTLRCPCKLQIGWAYNNYVFYTEQGYISKFEFRKKNIFG